MFTSSGYFRGVNCPFYASGLCERPYCHFRHSRVEGSKPSKTDNAGHSTSGSRTYQSSVQRASSYSSVSQTQPSSYGQTEIASYSTSSANVPSGPVEAYKTSENGSGDESVNWPIPSFTQTALSFPESNEEPVKYNSLPKISGLPKPRKSSSGTPSYIPTPKSKVPQKARSSVPSYEPTPKYSSGSSRKSANTIEYDPVKNFAFREKISTDDEDEQENVNEDDRTGKQSLRSNGAGYKESQKSEGQSSSDEGGGEVKGGQIETNNDLTDSDEDVGNNCVTASSSIENLPSYAELLTPSSYFTKKLDTAVSDSSTTSVVNGTRKLSTDSRSSTERGHGSGSHKKSDRKSTHKSLSSKSESKSRRNSETSHNSGKKSHRSLSISASHSSSEQGKKSQSLSLDVKPSSSTSLDKKSSSSTVINSHSKPKSSTSSHGKSSHKERKSSTEDSTTKPSSTHHIVRGGSSTSEKENRNSSKEKSNKQSATSSSSSKTHHSSHKRESSELSHKSQSSDKKPHSHRETKDSTSAKLHKQDKDVKSSRRHSSSKSSHSSISTSKVKVEQTDDISSSKHKDPTRHSNSSIKTEKGTSSSNSKELKIKQERRSSASEGRKKDRSSVHSSPREKRNSVTQRHINDLTSNLFGEESDGSGADSDVQIVEPPEEPPPPVVELSDSDPKEDDTDNEEDLSFLCPTDDVDLLSDSDTFDECLRIFQESERQMAAKKGKKGLDPNQGKKQEVSKSSETSENLLVSLGKKRMAHQAAAQVTRRAKAPALSRPRLSPAEVMHNRIVEMQRRALLRAARREGRESELPLELTEKTSGSTVQNSSASHTSEKSSLSSSSLSAAAATLLSTQKKREAHTPVLKTPTKTPVTSSSNSTRSPNSFYGKSKTKETTPSQSSKLVTVAGTASKTEKRKAHEPALSTLKRPIPLEFGDKVPTNIRQRYLNLIIDEYLKFKPEESAFSKGLEEEKAVYTRASNKNIYLRLAVNAIKRIRTEAMESQPSSSKKVCTGLNSLSALAQSTSTSHALQSHAATLGGSWAAKTSFTLNRSGAPPKITPQSFKGRELYDRLKKYILTEEELRVNGFPRPSEDGSSKAKIYKEEERDKMLKDNERTCKRCGKRFYVDEEGSAVTMEQCIYHYGNAFKRRVAGSFDSRYACCGERSGSNGCQVAKCHVHERNKTDNLTGFMKTMPASPTSEKNYGVYALDCEMVYTRAGLELARVTVTGEDNSVKYETLVKPDTEIIDYNTRFSGITESDMKGVTTTLRGVQAVMLSMFSDKTILIGHSLESDLQSLKMIHNTVVDTSIMFPHNRGPPFKRALRNLMVDYLQKIIQTDDGGHDSKEDAVACMQLVLYKVKEDAKREVRRV